MALFEINKNPGIPLPLQMVQVPTIQAKSSVIFSSEKNVKALDVLAKRRSLHCFL